MLLIQIKKDESIEKALKRFKKKFEKTKVVFRLREKQYFEKPSIKRRIVIKKAKYKNKILKDL